MVFAKYLYRRVKGRSYGPFGPYFYQGKKKDGKITLEYLGRTVEEVSKKLEISVDEAMKICIDALHRFIEHTKEPAFKEKASELVKRLIEVPAPITTVSDVVCPYCGCLCDDIEIVLRGGKIIETRNACELGARKFASVEDPTRIRGPLMRIEGKLREVKLEEAVKRAVEILVEAKRPLLYGWSTTECGAHQVGIEIAEEIGGIIDNTASICHGPTILALQEVGVSTCTLGEVKNRADLVIYWGSNPLQAHPRHLSRYTTYPHGFFRERGWRDRTLVVVDVRKTDTAKVANRFIQIEPNGDYELLSALRLAIRGRQIPEKVSGVPREEIEKLAKMMKECHFGAIFFGVGVTMSAGKNRNIDAVLSLVRDLNAYTKFIIMPMRGHHNVTGFNEVLTWRTGYPYAVDFSRGYPRYNPGETSVIDVLARKEIDVALIVGSDPIAHFPLKAAEHLMEIPVITLDAFKSLTTEISEVVIPAAISGIEAEGTAYRMDHVPIRMRKFLDPPQGCLPDKEILRLILEEIRKLKGGEAEVTYVA